jgi:non-lysosomal glucosylceramidase
VTVPSATHDIAYAGVTLPGDATVAAFPLGGIGTGNVSLGARGEFRDWELFNAPGKGNKLPYSFFSLHCRPAGGEPTMRILEGRLPAPHEASHGYYSGDLAGLPRMEVATMRGSYPFVEIDLHDPACPVTVSLEAFSPLVPLDASASGIPAAVLRYHVTNPSADTVEVTIAGSLSNPVGMDGYELFFFPDFEGRPRNEYREDDEVRGLYFTSDLDPTNRHYGSLALMTTEPRVTHKAEWLTGYWWDGAHDFWDEFAGSGRLSVTSRPGGEAGPLSEASKLRVGSLAAEASIAPGGRHTFEFILAWHFPNRPRGWLGHIAPHNDTHSAENVRNHYATRYTDAWDVGRRLLADLPVLERSTRAFHSDLVTSSVPPAVIDALLAGLVVLRSTTCFRIEDGTFLSWEGTFDRRGSCEGNCTHVWNYAQTAAFLFPELEHSMRRTEFRLETDASGAMAFRSYRVFGGERWDMLPAVDGQLGCVVRLYRDWLFSGDDELLVELWPAAKRALDYAAYAWDADGDGVLDSEQHNTYDIEFHGPNSLTNSVYFAALTAGSLISTQVGEQEQSARYAELARAGADRMDALLWGGEYYVQVLDDVDRYRYQYGTGCLSDQVFGQYLAHVAGLGYVLPSEHVRAAVNAVFDNNFRSMADHHNVQRTYALNDESGLLLCSWPHGGRPRLPFVYSDEVWAGIEYQVAAHLVYEGEVDKALRIVAAVRDRYDGHKRNPWNEVECGNHYVRSMASWALLLALSGYRYDAPAAAITFDPRVHSERFQCLFTGPRGWGQFRQEATELGWSVDIHMREGQVRLGSLTLRPPTGTETMPVSIVADGETLACATVVHDDGRVTYQFGRSVTLTGELSMLAGSSRPLATAT